MLRRSGVSGVRPAPDRRIRDDEVHDGVMRLAWQVRPDERLEADADAHCTGQPGQQPVVQPGSTPESRPVRTEGHARDDDRVDGCRLDRLADRLADPAVPRRERLVGTVGDRDDLAVHDAGQQHTPCARRSEDQRIEVDLVGIGRIEQHPEGSSWSISVAPAGPRSCGFVRELRERAECRDDRSRRGRDRPDRKGAALREQRGAQRAFGVDHSRVPAHGASGRRTAA
jgi:hypothetical protein